jgi:hypothetical protein
MPDRCRAAFSRAPLERIALTTVSLQAVLFFVDAREGTLATTSGQL